MKNTSYILTLFAILLTWEINGVALAQNSALPTQTQAQAAYDAGAYRDCLQQISWLLALKGQPAAGVNREKLLLLRGDCFVKLRDSASALQAYRQAQASDDSDTWLKARAGVVILQGSRGVIYTPAGAQPIDVTTQQGWSKAAAAIFDIRYSASQNDIKAARTAQDMATVLRVVPTIADLAALNLITGGDNRQLMQSFQSVDQRARYLISRELDKQNEIIGRIVQRADAAFALSGYGEDGSFISYYAGLGTNERNALQQVIVVAKQAYDVAVDCKQSAQRLGGDAESWQGVIDTAVNTGDRAQSVLDAQ